MGEIIIQLSERQEKIIDIVKKDQPITSEAIANELDLTRSTLRPDLAILTMSGILDARPKVGYFYTGKTSLSYISEKIKGIKVSEVKSFPIVVDESTSIYDAIVTMFLEDVGSIYVTSNGFLSGVVSRKDFLRNAIGGMDLNKVPMGMIMTRMPNIVYIELDDSILDAAIKLIEHEVDSLPVVETDSERKNFKVIGRITKTTITRLFVELGTNE
ncbi:helix-turn-helix transcriptional regulator [Tissierella praeacuta]|uniref:helix-turn-helix transcriptional regulator n=1 Tax=Tissierella praeacuta TaxID=43131 RepID=UPI00333FC031